MNEKDSPIDDPEIFDSIAHLFVPLGFVDAKEMLVPLSRIVLKWAMSEHFAVFSNPARDSVLKHLVLVLSFWLRHPLMSDTFFSSTVLEAVWFFLKSGSCSSSRAFRAGVEECADHARADQHLQRRARACASEIEDPAGDQVLVQ